MCDLLGRRRAGIAPRRDRRYNIIDYINRTDQLELERGTSEDAVVEAVQAVCYDSAV
jgi:hypothetical protein